MEKIRELIATELAKHDTGKTLYILDEPTTGLHFEDIHVLLNVLDKLVERGNTLIVIEHNLDVILHADYLIDMGNEGGRNGGNVVCVGTPNLLLQEVSDIQQNFKMTEDFCILLKNCLIVL